MNSLAHQAQDTRHFRFVIVNSIVWKGKLVSPVPVRNSTFPFVQKASDRCQFRIIKVNSLAHHGQVGLIGSASLTVNSLSYSCRPLSLVPVRRRALPCTKSKSLKPVPDHKSDIPCTPRPIHSHRFQFVRGHSPAYKMVSHSHGFRIVRVTSLTYQGQVTLTISAS